MATEDAKERNLQNDGIREIVSTFARRVAQLHSTTNSGRNQHYKATDGRGIGVTVFAGSNAGAVMRVNMNDMVDGHGMLLDDQDTFGAYACNNYQAVNDSVMVNDNYISEDDGVHMAVSGDHVQKHIHGKKRKEEKKRSENQYNSNKQGKKTRDSGP